MDLKQQASRLEALNGERRTLHPPGGTKRWHEDWDHPKAAGIYLWRLTPQWEPVHRRVEVKDGRLVTNSHRFLQEVELLRVGGQWFY